LRDYELVYIIRPNVAEEVLTSLNDRVQSWIGEIGGEVQKVNPWGRRRLAYPIRDFREGLYVQVNFRAAPRSLKPIDRNMKLTEDVIRYMMVRPGE
jgi:small subunit ribosomal protein S6